MSLKELKLECRDRGLKVSGKKGELLTRLKEVYKSTNGRNSLTRNRSKRLESVASKKQATPINFGTKSNENVKLECNSNSDDSLSKLNDTITTTINESDTKSWPTEQDANSLIGHHKRNPPIEEHREDVMESEQSADQDGMYTDRNIASSSPFGIRDKFFLLTSTTCITIWWWWPYMPNFIDQTLRSYRYLQSFF